jgi:hypothetical protein
MSHSIPRWISRALIFVLAVLTACGEGDPVQPPVLNEHPPATTIVLTLARLDSSGSATTDSTSVTVRDTTVVKGKPAIVGTLSVQGGARYRAVLTLLDESGSSVKNVTGDISAEKEGHLFLITPVGGIDASRIQIGGKDKDANGADVGLTFQVNVSAGAAAMGMLNVVLRHYDSNNKQDTVYDTDIDMDVPIEIR